MNIKTKWKELKNWKKGSLIGLLVSIIFIIIYSLNLLSSKMTAELDNHAMPIWGYFAIMIVFYVPIFMIVGGVIGAFIKRNK